MKHTEELHPHMIRFPEDLYQRLKEMAAEDRRAFNWEVIHLLEVGVKEVTIQKGKAQQADSQPPINS